MIKKSNISLVSKKKLFSNSFGEHNTILSGSGLEFKELREYVSGDNVRYINAKVTARTRVAHVNVFNEDKKLNITVAFLNSGSIYFGSKRSKQNVMVDVLINLCAASLHKKDLLCTIFYDENQQYLFKPTKDKKTLLHVIDIAISLKPLGNSIDYKKLNNYLLAKVKKNSILFIVGDFLDFDDFKILGAKYEVYAVIIRDKLEEDIQVFDGLNLKNMINKDNRFSHVDKKNSKKYKKQMQEYDKKLFKNLQISNIRYEKIYTCDNVVKKLKKLLHV